jgi:predicted nucleic acid-binding protein
MPLDPIAVDANVLQLIATLMANGVEQICTFNRQDFEGFPGLQVLTP